MSNSEKPIGFHVFTFITQFINFGYELNLTCGLVVMVVGWQSQDLAAVGSSLTGFGLFDVRELSS